MPHDHDPSAPQRHIVAIGGGGLSEDAGDRALTNYILDLAAKDVPKVCFVGTASGDDDAYADAFFASFDGISCRLSRLTVLKPMARSPQAHLAEQDVIYVGGGNAFHMLVLWRSYGIDKHLRKAWERGAVMCGVSAGSMCWFQAGIRAMSHSAFQPLTPLLALLPSSNCPHYDSQPARRTAYLEMVAAGRLPPGYAIGDGAALHFTGTNLAETVTFRPGAAAYRVEPMDAGADEHELPTRSLIGCAMRKA